MTLVNSSADGASIPGAASPNTVADILTAAADLIEKPGAWTQGAFARDEHGCSTGWRSEDAKCFCVSGAITRAGDRPAGLNRAWQVFNDWTIKRGFSHLARFNDAPGRTQAEVVAALREAAALARVADSAGSGPSGDEGRAASGVNHD